MISNIYPENESTDIPFQPTLFLTINHLQGLLMNVTWYVGSDSTNVTTVLGTDTNITNGTIYKQYIQVTSEDTTYYWKINIEDENGFSIDYIYHFDTLTTLPTVVTTPFGILAVAILFSVFFVLFIIYLKRKKPKEKEYPGRVGSSRNFKPPRNSSL